MGWVIDSLLPYLYPNAQLKYLLLTFFGEISLMLWLLIRGWTGQEPKRELSLASASYETMSQGVNSRSIALSLADRSSRWELQRVGYRPRVYQIDPGDL
jgi:hypothetical protein